MTAPQRALVTDNCLVWRQVLAIIMLMCLAAPTNVRAQYNSNIFETLGNVFLGTLNSALDFDSSPNNLDYYGSSGGGATSTTCQGPGAVASRCPYAADPDAMRNVSQIIMSRGFRVEEHDVITRDGYVLSIQRIVNPLVSAGQRQLMKPIILQHGLMASSVDWVINSADVRPVKPRRFALSNRRAGGGGGGGGGSGQLAAQYKNNGGRVPLRLRARMLASELALSEQDSPNSLGFYLANEGYDVFLANSRGNIYAQRHVNLTAWDTQFWAFSFDEQIKYDLPDTLEHVRRVTRWRKKVGYVGHSQGTTMMLGLLSDQPQYADIFEPIVLLAPVAFVGNCVSPARFFALSTPVVQHLNMWFGSSRKAVKYLAPFVCGPNVARKDLCTNLIFLSAGFNEQQLNETRVSAYLSHMPSGTSWRNLAHWGQAVLGGRFAHFDHGHAGNQQRYGQPRAPDYNLARVRSKSLALFTADNDWLSSPPDVARLKMSLQVPLYKLHNVSQTIPQWNHIDFLYGKDTGRVVNDHIIDIFSDFADK